MFYGKLTAALTTTLYKEGSNPIQRELCNSEWAFFWGSLRTTRFHLFKIKILCFTLPTITHYGWDVILNRISRLLTVSSFRLFFFWQSEQSDKMMLYFLNSRQHVFRRKVACHFCIPGVFSEAHFFCCGTISYHEAWRRTASYIKNFPFLRFVTFLQL